MTQQVFCVPGRTGIIDLAVNRGGVLVSDFMNETIEQVALRYPGVIVCTMDDAITSREAAFKTDPVEITEDTFIEMLEVLPPMGWAARGNTESFKMCEFTVGSITAIYARVGQRFFHLSDVFTLTHDEIMAKVQQAFPLLH